MKGNFFRINLATNLDRLKEVIKRVKLNHKKITNNFIKKLDLN